MSSKKGKGKPRPNKPPNPNPPQKQEEIVKDAEIIENVLKESIESPQKVEERVPEIISEVITSPVLESKDKEGDSPKKPKRNRGKKKKHEKDDDDNLDQQSDAVEDVKVEIVEVETQEIVVEEVLTPNVRKKKNKKGADSDSKVSEKQEKETPLLEDKNIEEVNINVREEVKSPDIEDVKPSKKKNKKKKQRNDSERSDKTEEVSCTSAFLDLLKDDKADSKIDDESFKGVAISDATFDDKKDTEIKTTEQIGEIKKDSVDTTKLSAQESGGKNKKKNKKDKKEPPKEKDVEILDEPCVGPENPLIASIESILKDDVVSKKTTTAEEQPVEVKIPITTGKSEENVKSKAKIAKPVERKRKDNTSGQELPELLIEGKEKDTSIKQLITPEPLAEVSFDLPVITSPVESKTELLKDKKAVPEVISEKESKEVVINPAKQKGKTDKRGQGQPIETSTQVQSTVKDVVISPKEDILKTEPSSSQIEIDNTKESQSGLPEICKQDDKRVETKQKGKKSHKQELIDLSQEKKSILESLPEQTNLSEPVVIPTQKLTETSITENIDEFKTKPDAIKPKEFEDVSEKHTEKKRKGKADQHKDNLMKPEVSAPVKEFTEQVPCAPVAPAVETVNISLFSDIIKDLITTMPEPIENVESKQEVLHDTEVKVKPVGTEDVKTTTHINPPDTAMGKKRKKSPKPQKKDQRDEVLEVKPEVLYEPIDFSKIEVVLPTKKEAKEEDILTSIMKEVTEQHEKSEPLKSVDVTDPTAKTEELLQIKEDNKSKKKRKKSPKLPLDPEPTETENKPRILEIIEDVTKKEIKPVKLEDIIHAGEKKGDTLYDMPPVEEIDIRSLTADESEGSTCGFTPDIIQHPRATSQELLDNNNNMGIQEITIAEEMKLQIPVDIPDTPFIQGSGATPLETPESVIVGSKVCKMNVGSKGEAEKTDIKSKMMEVNQDMEELRLSIERSLAELTSIEKSEGEIEKKCQETPILGSEEPKPSEVKISMPSEMVAKTPAKTVEVLKSSGAIPLPYVDKPVEMPTPAEKAKLIEETPKKDVAIVCTESTPVTEVPKADESFSNIPVPPVPPMRKSSSKEPETKTKTADNDKQTKVTSDQLTPVKDESKPAETGETTAPPVCPARKDNKNKSKNKKKGKQEQTQATAQTESHSTTTEAKDTSDSKKEVKEEKKPESTQGKGKQQSDITSDESNKDEETSKSAKSFDPIENFEDAMTSSADDINQTFEIIADEANRSMQASHVNPEIKIVAPIEDKKTDKKPDKRDGKINPVSPSKNLQGHPDIPVRSNRTDYKKEKNKTPNAVLAKVKIKDAVEIESKKQTKDTQTDNIQKFLKSKSIDESFSSVTNENEEFVYKYSFRKVFLQSACHVCKKELKQARVPCNYCSLVFYCNAKHKDEDWPLHQGLCFAVSTIVHLKDQKHLYADAKNVTGQDYRLLRMQMIVSCERVLKRKLTPWEQEALLYPRMCADPACREWRQSKLVDCDGCGQISYCSSHQSHFPKSHQRWCKSYSLYQKLVCHQQTKGRLEPKLPGKVMTEQYLLPEKINEVLASMFEEKIDLNDVQYAALTQIATAPLTAAYCHQIYGKTSQANGTYKKSSCTVHIVGGELQFEADALNKWEVFFLHLRPQLQELRVVMIGADLNPSNLPLELLGKVKMCESCRSAKRRVFFSFQDKTTYHDYRANEDFITPDIVCAFNSSIKRSAMYNGKDPWPKTINCIAKQKVPFLVTSYTLNELHRDLSRVKECSEVDLKVIIDPKYNSFASVRPDRNFISDDEMPLLFKNYCYMLVCGVN